MKGGGEIFLMGKYRACAVHLASCEVKSHVHIYLYLCSSETLPAGKITFVKLGVRYTHVNYEIETLY